MAARGSGDKSERRREALTSSTGELVGNTAFLPRRVVRVYPLSDKVFDLLAGGFAQGRDAAKIHGVGLHQIRVKLMLADDLAKPIANLGAAAVPISWFRRFLRGHRGQRWFRSGAELL